MEIVCGYVIKKIIHLTVLYGTPIVKRGRGGSARIILPSKQTAKKKVCRRDYCGGDECDWSGRFHGLIFSMLIGQSVMRQKAMLIMSFCGLALNKTNDAHLERLEKAGEGH